MKFTQELKNSKGFTLVELMVVVAIIGILSAVAIPNFKKYQAKTKTSEAKLLLSSIYSAMTALQSDYDSFGTCLSDAGYVAPNSGNFYATGFSVDASTENNVVVLNGGTCANGQFQYPGSKRVGGVAAAATDLASIVPAIDSTKWTNQLNTSGGISTLTATSAYFIAGAIGPIDADNTGGITGGAGGNASMWAINENKSLQELNKGY